MKVAYNSCFGGFGLSRKAVDMMAELKGVNLSGYDWNCGWYSNESGDCFDGTENREDTDLVKVIETLGDEANGMCASLSIAEIPDGAEYEITEYDGVEEVVPPRPSW